MTLYRGFYFLLPWKSSVLYLFILLFFQPLGSSDICTVSVFLENCHIVEIVLFVAFLDWLLSLSSVHLISSMSFPGLLTCLTVNNIPVLTLNLILWTPWSIYSYSTRIWNNFSHRDLLFRKKRTIGVYRNSLSYNINWVPRIYCMGSPHVHSRNRRRYTGLLHISYHNYCYPNWSKCLYLTSSTSWGQYQMISCYDMSPGLHLPFYSRRLDQNCSSQFFPWYCSLRHILCSRTFPLRIIKRGCICYYRRICALISIILRLYPQHHMSQNPLCNHICRCEYNFFPTTFLRTIWYTMMILWLPRCIHNMKHHFIHRLIHLPNSSYTNNFHYLRSIRI